MRPRGSPQSRWWMTPKAVVMPARPLRSAAASAAQLRVGTQSGPPRVPLHRDSPGRRCPSSPTTAIISTVARGSPTRLAMRHACRPRRRGGVCSSTVAPAARGLALGRCGVARCEAAEGARIVVAAGTRLTTSGMRCGVVPRFIDEDLIELRCGRWCGSVGSCLRSLPRTRLQTHAEIPGRRSWVAWHRGAEDNVRYGRRLRRTAARRV
jgi:hypothetical protein